MPYAGLSKACPDAAASNALAGDIELATLGGECEFGTLQTRVEKDASILERDPRIVTGYLDTAAARNPPAGKVLQHCKRKVESFRQSLGGAVCVFKIGYCSNPPERFQSYKEANFCSMMLLHVTPCRSVAQMLEAALIDSHWHISGCRNEQPGGEGPAHVQASHFYVYVVGARADLPFPIGG